MVRGPELQSLPLVYRWRVACHPVIPVPAAMLAAVDGGPLFDAMANDAASAMSAPRRKLLDGAFEAVEGVAPAIDRHFEAAMIAVATDVAWVCCGLGQWYEAGFGDRDVGGRWRGPGVGQRILQGTIVTIEPVRCCDRRLDLVLMSYGAGFRPVIR